MALLAAGSILCAAPASPQSDRPLSPEAQRALGQGLAAVEQKDWTLAIRYFAEGHKATPTHPPLLFNLGLAHAKAGHDLAAAAWLNAYLVAAPSASNAVAVRSEIARLQAWTQTKIQKIFEAAIAAVKQLPQDDRERAFGKIAYQQASAGDVPWALKTDVERGFWSKRPSYYWSVMAKSLAEAGDAEGAAEALRHVSDAKDRDSPLNAVFDALWKQGDRAGARRVAAQIAPDSLERQFATAKIVAESSARGDFVPAEDALSKTKGEYGQWALLYSIVKRQAETGDFAGARRTVGRTTSPATKAVGLAKIAGGQLGRGDIPGARNTARELLALGDTARLADRAVAESILGNAQAAHALAERYDDSNNPLSLDRDEIFGEIAGAQALMGDVAGAQATARRAATQVRGIKARQSEYRIALALLTRGDVARALDALGGIPEGEYSWPLIFKGRALVAAAQKQIANGDLPGAEVTIAAIPRLELSHDWSGYLLAGKYGESYIRKRVLEAAVQTVGEQVAAMVTLAEAYLGRQSRDRAIQILAVARKPALEYMLEPTAFENIAAGQTKAGDGVGAQTTRAAGAVAEWLSLAVSLSGEERVIAVEKALQQAGVTNMFTGARVQAKDIPDQIAGAGAVLGGYLMQVRALEKKASQKSLSVRPTE